MTEPDFNAADFRGMMEMDEAIARFKKRAGSGESMLVVLVSPGGEMVLLSSQSVMPLSLAHAEKFLGSLQRSIAKAKEFKQQAAGN